MNINSGNVCCSTIHAADCSALHRASNFSFPFLFSPEAARNSGDAWPCSSVVVVEHYSLEASSVKHVGKSRWRLQRLLSQPLCYNLVVWVRPLKFSSSNYYALGNTTATSHNIEKFCQVDLQLPDGETTSAAIILYSSIRQEESSPPSNELQARLSHCLLCSPPKI